MLKKNHMEYVNRRNICPPGDLLGVKTYFFLLITFFGTIFLFVYFVLVDSDLIF